MTRDRPFVRVTVMNARQSFATSRQRGRLSLTITATPDRTSAGRALLADARRAAAAGPRLGRAAGSGPFEQYVVAAVGGRPVGIVGIGHQRGHLAELSHAYVRPYARSLGVAEILVGTAVDHAHEQGATRIVTAIDDTAALRRAG